MSLATAATTEGPTTHDLDELIERIGTGDRRAFEMLYRQTAPRVYGLVRQILRDPSQSEEISQEVYLEIWQTAARFDRSKGKAQTWVFTMAHHRAIDRVRASQASRNRDLRIGLRDQEAPRDSVAESIEVALESERVKAAMAALTPLQRRAIELSYFGGYTQSEVAELTGVGVSTAKTRLRDGLRRLRRELETETVAA